MGEIAHYMGTATNNQAEYTALLLALEEAQKLGAEELEICADSELLVHQIKGEYKVKHPGLIPLFRKAQALLQSFRKRTIRHVRREENTEADHLANEAIDNH